MKGVFDFADSRLKFTIRDGQVYKEGAVEPSYYIVDDCWYVWPTAVDASYQNKDGQIYDFPLGIEARFYLARE
jgi:hypothetical protein